MVFRTRRVIKKYAKKQRKQRKFLDNCISTSKQRNIGVSNRILEFKIKSPKNSFDPKIDFNNPFITKEHELNFFKHSRIPFTSFAAIHRTLFAETKDYNQKKYHFNLNKNDNNFTFYVADNNIISVLKLFSEFDLKTMLVSNLGSSLISYDIHLLSSFFNFFTKYIDQITEDSFDDLVFFGDSRVPSMVADLFLLSFEWIQFISSFWLDLEDQDFFMDPLDIKEEMARFDLEITKIEPEDRASEEDLLERRLEILKDYSLEIDIQTNILPEIKNEFIFTNFFFPVRNILEELETLQGLIDDVFLFSFLITKS